MLHHDGARLKIACDSVSGGWINYLDAVLNLKKVEAKIFGSTSIGGIVSKSTKASLLHNRGECFSPHR